jgi:hypothetical protein
MKTLALCCAFLLLSLGACNTNQPKNSNTSPAAKNALSLIQPPLPALNPSFQTWEFEPTTAQVFRLPSGTEISVPAQAFRDAQGKTLSGKIQLRYREFHGAVDIFLSGIPMNYGQRHMQTAGMFEIQAQQNGQDLKLDPQKRINIKFASREAGTDYNFFRYDEERGWNFVDYVPPVANPNKTKRLVSQPELAFPLDKRHFVFSYEAILDVMFNDDFTEEQAQSPSLKQKISRYGLEWLKVSGYRGVPYMGKPYMPSSLILWRRVSPAPFPEWLRSGSIYTYSIELIAGKRYKLSAVSSDEQQKYETTIEAVMPLKSLFASPPEVWEQNYQAAMAKVAEEEQRLQAEAAVFRSYELSSMGIYNFDKLMKQEQITVQAQFKAEGQAIEDLVFYLPEDNRTVIRSSKSDWASLPLLPNNKARFVSVLSGGHLAIFSAEEYQKLDFQALKTQGQVEINLRKSSQQVSTAAEVRQILGI